MNTQTGSPPPIWRRSVDYVYGRLSLWITIVLLVFVWGFVIKWATNPLRTIWGPPFGGTVAQKLWLPDGTKLLNPPGPIAFKAIDLHSPMVVLVNSRELFANYAAAAGSSEAIISGEHDLAVTYLAHMGQQSYRYMCSIEKPTSFPHSFREFLDSSVPVTLTVDGYLIYQISSIWSGFLVTISILWLGTLCAVGFLVSRGILRVGELF
ncbi:MAG TPA: hypothetical protein VJJ47_01880 [Candidatus Paceibacterota bacterium]